MSYKGEPQRILSGSWNLLPPGDLVQPPDALWIENWRVDQAGALRSRQGCYQVVEIPEGGAVRTLFRRDEQRYYGSGGDLYRQTGAGATPVLLASGYDGQPIGVASFQGYAWFMHRNKQKKDDGNTCSEWLAAAPTTAPAVSAGAQQTVVITGFNQSEEGGYWTVFNPSRVPYDPSWDTDNKVEGESSLWIGINPAGTWQAERLLSKDLGIDGEHRADDKCRIWINCSDPSKIAQIDLVIDCGDASFDRDYYRVTITPAHLSEQRWGWTCVEIRRAFDAQAALAGNSEYTALQQELADLEKRAQQVYDEYGAGWEQQRMDAIRERLRVLGEEVQGTLAFSRVGSTAGKDWSTVAAIRIQVIATDMCDVNFDQWQFYGGLNAPIEGDVYYAVSFDTAEGHETNAGPPSETIHVDKQAVTLNGIPVSPDPQVTKRQIYRGGGTLGEAYRVGTLNDNVTTTYVDRLPDADAINAKMLETDRDPPPPAMGMAGPYFGKLLAYGSDVHPNWLWWTKVNQPSCWPGSSTEEGSHEPIGDDGERLLRVTTHKRLAILYKAGTIWRLLGDPDDEGATIEQTNANIGILGPGAVADAGSLDYFAGPQGVYSFDFDKERKVSDKLDPIFKGAHTRLADEIVIPPISSQREYRARVVLAYANDLLYLSYPEEGHQWPTITVVYNPKSEQWVSMRTAAALDRGFTALYSEGESGELVAGSASGRAYAFGSGTTDAGQPLSLRYLSGYHNQGLPDNEKLYEDLVIEHNTGGSSITVKLLFADGTEELALGSINSLIRTPSIFQLNEGKGRRAYNAAVFLDGEVTTEVVIYGIFLHAEAEPRLARSWDSGVFDCGTDQVKEIDGLEFDIDAGAPVTWSLYGDVPGGNLSQRKTDNLAATGGRKTVLVSFALVEARRGRIYLSSPFGSFRLYAARVRVRPVGEYFDGSAGEIWESAEVGYGI